ncbi:hypothetical protein Bca52824_026310 [Brassica carinata]|uniref:RNase H type-1 domain-containing protein n=1 Tax=Brassica carinata TaxID=52824 RepID=A0A8X7SHV2_BRACI|nr:hypothetical protein Bca52824_026310 [Brassica carinata]
MTAATWTPLPPFGITSNALPWICWSLWTSRNRLLFEKRGSTPSDIMLNALSSIKEWGKAQSANIITVSAPTLPIPRYQHHRSSSPTICCNTDAAWQSTSERAGLAWIFTDQEGHELNWGSLAQDHISSACMAEAITIRSALLHIADLHYLHILLSSDS